GAAHADAVKAVTETEQRPGVRQRVLAEIDLDPPGSILEVSKSGLPLGPERHDAAGHGHVGPVLAHGVLIERQRGPGLVAPRIAVGKRRDAHRLDGRQVGAPGFLDPRPLHVRHRSRPGHAALPPYCLRYAWMNCSRSPSMTRCTSVTFTSVR